MNRPHRLRIDDVSPAFIILECDDCGGLIAVRREWADVPTSIDSLAETQLAHRTSMGVAS